MNKYLLPLIFLFVSSNLAFSQKYDYDHSTKWFFGINAGATWNCSDVKTELNSGWGLTLGRSYNWNYGSRISFDIRGRYLHGNWYGQNFDSTGLGGYTAGGPLDPYQSSGIVINNFYSDVHRLAIELVLHANGIAERTNFDPYIFGGVGVTWKQTWGNLKNDSNNVYDYNALVNAGNLNTTLPMALDGTYETRLDGLSDKDWSAQWLPSLGFGLGYVISPRVNFGLEHKTTFTKGDSFDGYSSGYPRAKNDWYHYTSAYLQFRFKTREKETKEVENTNNTINNFTTNCIAPTINTTDRNITSQSNTYNLMVSTSNITQASQISLTQGNGSNLPFNFNGSTQMISASIALTPGNNNILIRVQNDCGTATETINIYYNECELPKVSLTSPLANQVLTVQQNTLAISAMVENATASNIKLWVNGQMLNAFSYNPINHIFLANVVLTPGKNIIKIEAINNCGSTFESTEVVYNNCITPQLQLVSPSTSGTSVSVATQKILIKTLGFFQKSDFNILLNGQNIQNFTWSNGQLDIPVTLVNGNNTITVNGSNRCGSESIVLNLGFQPCLSPVITLQVPNSPSTTVTNKNFRLKCLVKGQTNMVLMVNNQTVTTYTYNAGTGFLDYSMVLLPGNNVFSLSATNACGVDIETINVFYDDCTPPTLNISSLSGTVNSSSYIFTATTTGISDIQNLKLTLNGASIPFNLSNGQVTAYSALNKGNNTFILVATNGCGTLSKTHTVNFNPCITPQINVLQPAANGITVNQNTYNIQANLSQVNSTSEISLKLNGVNQAFQFTNGLLTATLTLNPGNNQIAISATTTCGNDTESFGIQFKQCLRPAITLTSPTQINTTTTTGDLNIGVTLFNVMASNQITLAQNGLSVPFTLNGNNLTSSRPLAPGNNVFQITATNGCGMDASNFNVFYNQCIAPVITISPTNPIPSNVSTPTLTVVASVLNISSANELALLINGMSVPFVFSNGQIAATVALVEGSNTLSLTASNACGSDVKTKTINYAPCKVPTVFIQQPQNAGSTVNSGAFNFVAQLNNVNSQQELSLTLNGNPVGNFTLNQGILNASLNLIAGINTIILQVNNGCGAAQQVTTVNFSNCNSPSVVISNTSGTTVTNASYVLDAIVQNANSNQVTCMVNGQIIPSNLVGNNLSATTTLQAGNNLILVTVTNACGTDTKSIQVNYVNCNTPTVVVQNQSGTTQTNASLLLNATVQNATNQDISINLNGNPINNFSLVGTQLSATLNLQAGQNQITIQVQNQCGSANGTTSVNYQNCSTPSVQISTQNNQVVTQSLFVVSANITNMSNNQGIDLKLNGSSVGNFNFQNGILTANLNLAAGENNIVLSVINACGNDQKTLQVTYDHCESPVINVTSSNQSTSVTYTYSATITNGALDEGISIQVNGVSVPFTYNNGSLTASFTLLPGNNTVNVSVANNCGNDSETTAVNFSNCTTPTIQISSPIADNGFTTNGAVSIGVLIGGYDANTTIQISKNGTVVSGYSINNGAVSQSVNLAFGQTVITVSATNACGTDSQTYTINRCKAPSVSLINPALAMSNSSTANQVITIDVQNVNDVGQITMSQNGQLLTGLALAGSNLVAVSNLQPGNNSFIVNVNTNCGNAQLSFQINYTVTPDNNGGSNGTGNGNQGAGFGNNGNNNGQQNKAPEPPKPSAPVKAVDPPKANTPTKPTEPAKPTAPVKANEAPKVNAPVKTAEPAKSTEPPKASEPSVPVKTVKPTAPIKVPEPVKKEGGEPQKNTPEKGGGR